MKQKPKSSSSSSKGKQKTNSTPPTHHATKLHYTRKGKTVAKLPPEVVVVDIDSDDPMDSGEDLNDVDDVDSMDNLYSEETGMDSGDDEGNYAFVDNDGDDLDEAIMSRREKNYTVLSEEDIRQRQEEDITEISTVLSISRVSAAILLCHYNWSVSKVHDAWFADEEKVRTDVGLLERPTVGTHYPDSKKLSCGICFEDYRRNTMHAAACGHLFCSSCWTGYISTSINDGPGCLMLRCPDPKCNAAVGQDMVDKLVSVEDKGKYSRYLLRSYVEANRKTKWCPAPGCEYAVDFVVGSDSYDVSCNCTSSFCWNCLEDAHRPVDCDTVAKWILKNTAESENTTWILANSKPCPKCKRPIEKNHGCMHMTCTPPCKFQFCWLCLGAWTDHGKNTGGFYSCNRYAAAKQEGAYDDIEQKREMAKNSLERYTHYYERWAANQTSRQKAVENLQQMEALHIEKLSHEQCQLKSQLKFITDAWLQIIECRRVLKWTYAYGYYLPENEHAKKQFFEYLQGQAESALERLHKCAEKDLQVYLDAKGQSADFNEFRTKLAGLTSVTRNFFVNLVRALENGLADVDSVGACSTTCSSKDLGGGNKGKGRRAKGKTSKSTSGGPAPLSVQVPAPVPAPAPAPAPGPAPAQVPAPVRVPFPEVRETWSCEHCTYVNGSSATICQVCSRHRVSWSCRSCTYLNGESATICQMCNEQR